MNKVIFNSPESRKTFGVEKYYVSCNYKNNHETYYLQQDGTISQSCTNGWFDTKEEAEKAVKDYKENKCQKK